MHFTNALKDIYDYFSTVPNSTWYSIALVLGGSAVVTTTLQALKHWLTVTEKKYVIALLSFLSLLASFIVNFIQYGSKNPHFLGSYTPQIIGVSVVLYHFLTSPLYQKVIKWTATATAFNKELVPTAVPESTAAAATPTTETNTPANPIV